MFSICHPRHAAPTGRCSLRRSSVRRTSSWQRFAAALLCALFLWPIVAPISAFARGGTQASCCCKGVCHCRYCKRHHRNAPPIDSSPAFDAPGARCPCNPDLQLPISPARFALVGAPPTSDNIAAHPSGTPQTRACVRFTCIRVRHKRGPPALSSVANS